MLAGAAESWLRVLSTGDPQQALSLARFLGQCGRVDEALDLCEQARELLSPGQVTPVAAGIVLSVEATPRQIQRVDGWRIELLQQEHSFAAALYHAELLMALEQDDPAEMFYRTVLTEQPDNVVALNNLAWLVSCLHEDHQEAQRLIDRAIAVAGPVHELLDTRAIVRLNAGETQAAIRDLLDALDVSEAPHRRLHLAQAHWQAGNHIAATSQFRKAEQAGLDESKLNRFDRNVLRELNRQLAR